jgi:coenzyme F420-reducing hydrogenase alpha subunit
VRWTATLPFPDFERDHELVAVQVAGEYPIDRGGIASTGGLDIAPGEWDDWFVEEPVAHSNALHARIRGRGGYLAGPLARFSLNFDELSQAAREAALAAGVGPSCRNPFQSIVVRSVEMVYACDEALRIIAGYEPPDRPAVDVQPRAGVGFGVSEAPRGLLWHRYEIDDEGTILDARIVPPTSQNQLAIEDDLRAFVQEHVALPDDELQLRCEQAIRNHDPCISCATHFLTLDVERT